MTPVKNKGQIMSQFCLCRILGYVNFKKLC